MEVRSFRLPNRCAGTSAPGPGPYGYDHKSDIFGEDYSLDFRLDSEMQMILLLLIAGWAATLVLVLALCAMAGRGDRMQERELLAAGGDSEEPVLRVRATDRRGARSVAA